ncbi:MAG TPA: spore coat protein CotJB [Bacillota bacterium]|nr:spore coat protein CotJB [Bacillota bacterium]
MDAQHDLLRKIQALEFAIYDISLYLDTHPTDQNALCFYHQHREMLDAAVDEYTKCYGPLTIGTVESKNKWTWIEKPWPWELGA